MSGLGVCLESRTLGEEKEGVMWGACVCEVREVCEECEGYMVCEVR